MRIGIDLGGSKIEGIVMGEDSSILQRERVATPQGDYAGTLSAVVDLIGRLERTAGRAGLPVGIGHPGSVSPATGLMRNSNSLCLNGQPFQRDLEAQLGRAVRMANDANCLALSEARDGAAAGASNVFAVILGTGVGGGIVINGELVVGANGVGGEWGHNPLPWPRPEWDEVSGTHCWCGKPSCIETWLSGVGLAADHARVTGERIAAEDVVARAESGDEKAAATLSRYEDRLSRALAHIVNVLDPEVIVLGGGVSRVQRLYRYVPALWDQWIFSDVVHTRLVPARHGDSSGVRGAAWLWPSSAPVQA
ncbi:MAG: ROK family protein [Nevskiaceae bacterium]|nr:MAG: ROK family protein [Nevskiaceae bacterium]